MRYLNVPNILFKTVNGNSFTIKDFREIPTYTLLAAININKDDMLDEIAQRQEVYGEGLEDLCYMLFDMNVEKLAENNFNLSKLQTLQIPVLEQ
jgi:hypothetical protein